MKKIFIGLSAIFAFAFGFTGCDTDYVTYSGPDYIMFSDTLTVLPVQNNEEYFDIPVAATEACSYDRTLGVEILECGGRAAFFSRIKHGDHQGG